MTFDLGPSVNYSSQLLDLLFSKKVLVNFHFVTEFAADNGVQALMRRAANEGHLIGLRAESFWNLNKTSTEEVQELFKASSAKLNSITGQRMKFARLPYKQYNATIVVPAVEQLGFTLSEHNLDSYDYESGSNVLQSFKTVLDAADVTKDSFISLQQDSLEKTLLSLSDVIDYIKKKGYKIVLLDECLGVEYQPITTTTTTSTASSTLTIVQPVDPTLTRTSTTTSTSTTASSSTSSSAIRDNLDGNAAASMFSSRNFWLAMTTFTFGILLALL